MGRISGDRGRMYVGLASDTATAEPVAYLNKWSLGFTTDKIDVTAFGDTNKVYIAGLSDAAGDFAGWYDTASNQLYTAAVDGLPRKTYLYPSTADGDYFFGTAYFDFSVDVSYGAGVSVSGSFAAATLFPKVSA